jgi:hypothetical protein
MSTAATDYEHLLSEAINKARENAPRATDDLLRFSSRAAEAVDSVTRGAAALDLVPVNPKFQADFRYNSLVRQRLTSIPTRKCSH